MNCLLRFAGAVRRDPAIDAWLSDQSEPLSSIARQWFDAMRERGDDVRELIHDGCPVACVEDAPFGYVNVFKDHVNVGFFFGAELERSRAVIAGHREAHASCQVEGGC